ncbi:MAG: PaaI family thioesterase [Myxococcaceae bacterium]|nr:PaaI family thioesterase [Myxococcaceae bacterium]
MSDAEEQDYAELIRTTGSNGWIRANGLVITRATATEVRAELEIADHHRQSYGIVHGGIHAAIIETLASVGAAVNAMPEGRSVVGLENHTSFIRAVREGKLLAVARPITRGRRSHVWEGTITDEAGKIVATGRVRLLVLEPESDLAGEKVALKG